MLVWKRVAGLVAEGHADLTPEIRPAIAELEARLRTRATHLRAQMDETALLAFATERFAAARERIPRWRFADDGSGIVLPGFERVYGRFRDGLGAVPPRCRCETIHDWRKSAKAIGYHVRLFTPAAPDVLGPRAAVLGRLGDMLGDHHNSRTVRPGRTGHARDEATQAALLELIGRPAAGAAGGQPPSWGAARGRKAPGPGPPPAGLSCASGRLGEWVEEIER